MCKWLPTALSGMFKKKPVKPVPAVSPTVLPHPEEPEDKTQTDFCGSVLFTVWSQEYKHYLHPRFMVLSKPDLEVPAQTYFDEKLNCHIIEMKPSWSNPGVLAHEVAHIVYSQLSMTEQQEFTASWPLTYEDPYMALLMTQRNLPAALWGDHDVEMHAEIYRYLGDKMPDTLKRFYPGLV